MEYKEMINQLEYVINSKPYELPSLKELFCLGCSNLIIDGSYKGKYYGNNNGKKLLSLLNEKTKLLNHNKIEILRGSDKSDYSFHTNNSNYTYEYNDLKLHIEVFTPRSKNSTQYKCKCEL